VGVERTLDATGSLVEERAIYDEPPDDLYALLRDGRSGPSGARYVAVSGAWFDGRHEHRYNHIQVARVPDVVARERPEGDGGLPTPPPSPEVIGPALAEWLQSAAPSDEVHVSITLRSEPATRLNDRAGLEYASVFAASVAPRTREQVIEARKAEVSGLQAGVIAVLAEDGEPRYTSLWLTNDLIALVSAATAARLAAHPDVRSVARSGGEVGPDSMGHWDGWDMFTNPGLNNVQYDANGYDGQASNSVTGRNIRIAVLDDGFDADHPGFDDWANGPSRVIGTWECDSDGCNSPDTGAPKKHGTTVAGLAAGDARWNQFGNQGDLWEIERSGMSREAELIFYRTVGVPAVKLAIQSAVGAGVDIIIDSQ